MTSVVLIDTVLLILVTITAIAIIEVKNLYASAMLTSVYSLLMALVWVNMHSMDVAFTEAAVGGGISTILLIGTLVHTAREEKLIKVRVHWKAAAVTALTGAALHQHLVLRGGIRTEQGSVEWLDEVLTALGDQP